MRRCAGATASWDLTVNLSGCIADSLAAYERKSKCLRLKNDGGGLVALPAGPPDRNPDRLALIGGHQVPLVCAVRDELRLQRAADALHLRVHLALELLGALAHPLELLAHPDHLILHLQNRLHPGEVQALLAGHLLDPLQALDVALRVKARLLGRALRRDQPARLVHAQGLRMHLRELGRHRDHEDAAFGVDAAAVPAPPAAAPGITSTGHADLLAPHLAG